MSAAADGRAAAFALGRGCRSVVRSPPGAVSGVGPAVRPGGWPAPSARRLPDGRRLHLHQGPIDLVVEAIGPPAAVDAAYRRAVRAFAPVLETLASELGELRRPLGRHASSRDGDGGVGAEAEDVGAELRGAVARRMRAAALPHADTFVTPMAAVAGAVADAVLEAMLDGSSCDEGTRGEPLRSGSARLGSARGAASLGGTALRRASVNNGGDIAFRLAPGETLVVGLCVDPRTGELGGTLRLGAEDAVGGIATSGRHGRSHSLGIADAVTVLAPSAAEADVAATLIANAVDLPDDPRVERVGARELSPDSDLGSRPVTVGVAPLDAASRARALDAGARAADACRRAGRIDAAFLHLQGGSVAVGSRGAGSSPRSIDPSAHRRPPPRGRPASAVADARAGAFPSAVADRATEHVRLAATAAPTGNAP